MNDAGYTLVETMAALLVLSLAVGGLAAGVKVLSDRQTRIAATVKDVAERQRAQAAFERLLAGQGPFGAHQPERFAGRADAFAFECGEAQPCGARLEATPQRTALVLRQQARDVSYPLPRGAEPRFVYEGRLGLAAQWPPGAPERQALQAVAVVAEAAGAEQVLLRSRIWLEQPVTCAFDPVLEDCR